MSTPLYVTDARCSLKDCDAPTVAMVIPKCSTDMVTHEDVKHAVEWCEAGHVVTIGHEGVQCVYDFSKVELPKKD